MSSPPQEIRYSNQSPECKPGLLTEYGKWIDGWETRRKRIPGHDWCIIQLGLPGVVHGFEADTSFFVGNCAPRISIQAACLKQELSSRGNRLGTAATEEEFKAVKQFFHRWMVIFFLLPIDGGIARFKVYGTVQRDWSTFGTNDLKDLVAMVNGGVCVGFSDWIGWPIGWIGRATSIEDGWETGRKLNRPSVLKADGKGALFMSCSEWAIFRLAHPGIITHIEIDTNHFKGSFPDNCKLEACVMNTQEEKDCVKQKWNLKQGLKWNLLLSVAKLNPHKRHFFNATAIQMQAVITHVKLTIVPDGGVSRLRLWGFPRALSKMNK
uniref:Allantoate amidinohydrolase n=1 Tax=Sphenodon punctatus TaxID=8508 RepID=A0A8D0GQ06_SPHPU